MTLAGTRGPKNGSSSAPWIGLLLLVVLAPIPFGGNRPWAWSLIGLWASTLLTAWAVSVAVGRRSIVWRKALIVPVAIFLAELFWILAAVVPGMGPANPIWQLAAEQLHQPLVGRMTLSVESVLVGVMRLLSYVSIFWLSFQYCRNRDRAASLMSWIAWSGFAFALYGLVNSFVGNKYLLWYPRWTGLDDVTATFVNRNHYATYAGFGLICSLSIAVMSFRAAWRVSDRSQATLARTIECLTGRSLLYLFIMLVIAMAWLQTHSRMGMAAVVIGVFVILIMMRLVGLVGRSPAPWVALLILTAFLFEVSGGGTLDRVFKTSGDIARVPLYSIVSEQIASAPYTGSGYGTFAQAFVTYRDTRLLNASIYLEAHNGYLELASEIGIPATLLFIFGIAWCAGLCLIGSFRRRTDRIYPIVATGVTVVVAGHSLLDFSVQIPAVAITYAAILGMGVAQSWSTEERR